MTVDLVVLKDPVVLLRDVGPQQTGGYLSVASGREELPDVMEQGRHDGLGVRPVPGHEMLGSLLLLNLTSVPGWRTEDCVGRDQQARLAPSPSNWIVIFHILLF